ncbi:hypothetical protein [Bacillus fonticola]|uniref:hypothetical protein n=1 Tax=Bacillus fonticola TaxID=2728853 RepID=UPI001473A7B6|nr:hypothetical protein [Bacillus fonticola]
MKNGLSVYGLFLFISIVGMSFLQLDTMEERIEVILFGGAVIVLLFVLLALFQKRPQIFIGTMFVLALTSVVVIFLYPILF